MPPNGALPRIWRRRWKAGLSPLLITPPTPNSTQLRKSASASSLALAEAFAFVEDCDGAGASAPRAVAAEPTSRQTVQNRCFFISFLSRLEAQGRTDLRSMNGLVASCRPARAPAHERRMVAT